MPAGVAPPGDARARRVRIELADELDWPASGATLVSDRRPATWIEAHPQAGHLLAASGAGRVHVALGAERVIVERRGAWQRHLLARALPFVASQRGLEPLHAAAVTAGGRAIALAGGSGAGKSTLAAALAQAGARLLADDVVAIEAGRGTAVMAHPGVARVRLRHDAFAQVGEGLGEPAVRDADAVELAMVPAAGPVPLGALVLLGDRRPGGVDLERLDPVDPRLVLSTSYDLVTSDPARLVGQLDLCARIASGVPCLRLAGGKPQDAAVAVLAAVA